MPDLGVAEASPGASNQIGQFSASTSTYQHGAQSAALANAAGTTTTSSYNTAGSTGGSNAHGFTLPAGSYQFQYITSKGVTKTFHAKIVHSNGSISIHFAQEGLYGHHCEQSVHLDRDPRQRQTRTGRRAHRTGR
jgi:pectate lyase